MAAIETSTDGFKMTMGAGTTYVGIGGDASLISSSHIQWDATYVGVISFEGSNFPDVSVAVAPVTPGDWVPINPSTAQIDIVTGSATVVAAVITVPGGTAGGALITVGNSGYRRIREKFVTATPGVIRERGNGKE